MGKELTLLLPISDVHVGRKTDSFDAYVMTQRMMKYTREVSVIIDTLEKKGITVKPILLLLGDIVDGEAIYATHPYELELPINEQLDLALETFNRVVDELDIKAVYGVPGNHGRVRKDGTGNYDVMFYKLLEKDLDSRGIPFEYETRLPKRIFNIGDMSILLSHGNTIRMYMQIPYYGITREIKNEYMLNPFDMGFYGHFHVQYKIIVNNVPVYGNGTMLSDDFLSRKMGLKPSLAWWVVGVSEEKTSGETSNASDKGKIKLVLERTVFLDDW